MKKEQKPPTMEEFLKILMDGAKENLLVHGELAPCLILISKDYQLATVPILNFSPETRAAVHLASQMTIKHAQPKFAFHIADIYMRVVPAKEMATHTPGNYAKDPKAVEAIQIAGLENMDRQVAYIQKYHREDNVIVFDGEPELLEGYAESGFFPHKEGTTH